MKEEGKKYYDIHYDKYQASRLGYPDAMYKIISDICGFNSYSNILEIGAGPGTATEDIIKYWQPHLTLIEPGCNFAFLLRQKFKKNEAEIICTMFEDYHTNKKFDGIISATAFHWIDLSIKYKKSFALLNDNGFLVLYWNNYSVYNDSINQEISSIYESYGEKFECNLNKQQLKIENCRKELTENNEFELIKYETFENIITLSSNIFIDLLQTFIGHSSINQQINKDIENLLAEHNNMIDVRILTNLAIAKK